MKKKLLKTLYFGLASVAAVGTLASCSKPGTTSEVTTPNAKKGEYVFNTTYGGTFSEGAWDPLDWQSNLDDVPLSYTSIGFYAFNFNEDYNGYTFDPEMATAEPKDVTADYQGKYNVPQGAKNGDGYAYEIAFRDDIKFDNGHAVNADTFIESYKLLIDSKYENYRANNYEANGFSITNSANYHYKGQTTLVSTSKVVALDNLSDPTKVDIDTNVKEKKYWVNLDNSFGYTKEDVQTAHPEYTDEYFTENGDYINLGSTYTEAYAKYVQFCNEAGLGSYADKFEGWFPDESFVNYTYPEVDEAWFDQNVGLKKVDDYTILLVLDQPVDVFTFKTQMTSTWLVDPQVYKDLTETGKDGNKSTKYNHTVDTSVSYGPYKMDTYTTTEFSLVRNDSWYGYSDGRHEGQYETDRMVYHFCENDATILMGFKKGEYDEVTLTADNVNDYLTSSQLLDSPTSYTMSLFTNSNKDLLKKLDSDGTTKNAVLFSYDDFRKAFSYAMNREDAALAAPGSSASALLLNTLYMSDAEHGEVYRNQDAAKEVYSLVYGEGAKSVKDSYSEQLAIDYFNKAYDAAVAAGDYTNGAEIKFNIGLTNTTSSEYTMLLTNINKYINTVLPKTKFGNVKFTLIGNGTASARYADLLAGKTVLAFCAWGGATFDPYKFVECYFSKAVNYMPGFDPEVESTEIVVNGTAVKKSFYQWYLALNQGEYSAAKVATGAISAETRVYILSRLEAAYLALDEIIPLYANGSKSLYSYKVAYPTKTYVTGVGFGGIQYMSYNYDSVEWEAEIAKGLNY